MNIAAAELAARLKESVTMPMLIDYLRIESNRGYICCPFHSEKTPSMKIWDDHYKCYGCGEYGDVISFTQKYYNIGFIKAVEMLNEAFNVGLPMNRKMTPNEIRRAREAQQRRNEEKARSDRIKEQFNTLNILWASLDRIIIDHPVPDNERTAAAYRDRQYIAYLIDYFNPNEGYSEAFFSTQINEITKQFNIDLERSL